MRIGWIGTGVMGAPMVGHLLEAGHDVRVHTRTRARAAVIGVVTASDRTPAERVATELLAADPQLVVAYGGRSAPIDLVPEASHRTGEPFRLPSGPTTAVEALKGALTIPRR